MAYLDKKPASSVNADAETKVIAVQLNQTELAAFRAALEEHAGRGSRATVIQLIRWAANNIDFEDMTSVP